MTDTIKKHFDNCKTVSTILDDANALLSKTQRELQIARDVLESLTDMQHPKLRMNAPYSLRQHWGAGSADATHSPAHIIDAQVKRINALLGDRA